MSRKTGFLRLAVVFQLIYSIWAALNRSELRKNRFLTVASQEWQLALVGALDGD